MNATYKSIAMGEQNHRIKTCIIMFDEAHKLYSKTNIDNVSRKGATEMTVMIDNTATLKSTSSLESAVYADNEVPPEEHDDLTQAKKTAPLDALYPKIRGPSNEHDDLYQAKKTAPLDALFPKIRVPSNDENMHESTQEDEKNPAMKAAKTTMYTKSELASNRPQVQP
jgi:hypothetical protein